MQLRLAYAALVGAAAATPGTRGLALAQFCVSALLDDAPPGGGRHRQHLALVSTLSALPLALLPNSLAALRACIVGSAEAERTELVHALYGEILERIGDKEKEFAMRWWVDNRAAFGGWDGGADGEGGDAEASKGKAKAETSDGASVTARL